MLYLFRLQAYVLSCRITYAYSLRSFILIRLFSLLFACFFFPLFPVCHISTNGLIYLLQAMICYIKKLTRQFLVTERHMLKLQGILLQYFKLNFRYVHYKFSI